MNKPLQTNPLSITPPFHGLPDLFAFAFVVRIFSFLKGLNCAAFKVPLITMLQDCCSLCSCGSKNVYNIMAVIETFTNDSVY